MSHFLTNMFKLLLVFVLSPFWLFSDKDIENKYNISNSETKKYNKTSKELLNSFKKNRYLGLNSAYNFPVGFNIKNQNPFAKLVVSELTGKDIYEISLGKISKGYHFHKWNRVTNFGEEVKGGIYFLSIYEDGVLVSKQNIVIFNILG